jgi:phosphatidylserine decarboxylase
MKCIDRDGYEINQNETQNKVLSFLYQTKPGRCFLSILVRPWVSNLTGFFLNLPVSRWMIGPFVQKNNIDLSEYEEREFHSYNDFFTRRIREGHRKIDEQRDHLIAPCDSKLSVYPIREDARFCIKDTQYSMESLLKSKKLAAHYEGGQLLVFRLTVDDYHRFCYADNGLKSRNYHIPGVFHTVNPLANDVFPIYKENTREFSILKSENFGNMLVMEVGALLVGKIVNYHEKTKVIRGQEKGRFEFGGSTVILCIEKGKAILDADILENSANGIETVVKMGERIGVKQ